MNKQLPSNKEMEQSIIWILFTADEKEVEEILSELQMEYIYDITYRKVIESVYEIVLIDWIKLDLLSIKTKLEKKWILDDIWWLPWLVDFTEMGFLWNYKTIIEELRSLYKKREVILEARRIENRAFTSNDIDEDIINSFDKINNILMEWGSKATDVEENIKMLEEYIEANKSTDSDLIWWSWWEELKFLDFHTRWIRKWKTYRIGAPSWVGKTNLVYQTIHSLIEQWAKVLFVSLENDIESTYTKFLSCVQRTNPYQIEKGIVKPDLKYLRDNKDRFILTDCLFDINEIKREVLKQKPDVVILDYIWLTNIKWANEDTLYQIYADEIKKFVQTHKWLSWIDLSNLRKNDTEETIRKDKWFNWAAKLRNNTDFALHMFEYAPFAEYKNMVFEMWTKEAKMDIIKKKAITFLITKNRLWGDLAEQVYTINFDKWIRYTEATDEQVEIWKTLND